ncbi:MAG: phosphate signaling complex protein PhoU [Gammaproteobacteria bacterium]|jgi:phosphate transport system protein
MKNPSKGHTVESFNEEMKREHKTVLQMGALVRTQIKNAIRTLQEEDAEEARKVIAADAEVNNLDIQVAAHVEHILARRTPVAGDLREVLTVAKIATDLERCGDEAGKLARLTIHFFDDGGTAPNYQLLQEVSSVAGFVDQMLQESLDAFDERNIERACEVIRKAESLDGEFRSSLRRLTTFVLEDARTIGQFIDVVLAVRALERIGGHAKNIGGYVVYLVTGRDVRHEDLATIEKDLNT